MPISEVKNMDCLEAMKAFPDKYFELAVVDPPYGIKQDGRNNHTRGGRAKAKDYQESLKYDDDSPRTAVFNEIIRVSKNQIFFGANHYINKIPYPSPCWIVWDKMNAGNDFADCELAWTSFKSAVRMFGFKWSGMLQGNMSEKENRIHPNHKPIALYKWLLTNYAKPGDKILDTHLGSGSSRIAAYDMGFDFWGYELDADYFASMEARFQAHISKPVLFAPDQMYDFEQKKLFE